MFLARRLPCRVAGLDRRRKNGACHTSLIFVSTSLVRPVARPILFLPGDGSGYGCNVSPCTTGSGVRVKMHLSLATTRKSSPTRSCILFAIGTSVAPVLFLLPLLLMVVTLLIICLEPAKVSENTRTTNTFRRHTRLARESFSLHLATPYWWLACAPQRLELDVAWETHNFHTRSGFCCCCCCVRESVNDSGYR